MHRSDVEFSSQLFVPLKSPTSVLPSKMKALSFRRATGSVILRVIIDDHSIKHL